jgi:monoamine oxidase
MERTDVAVVGAGAAGLAAADALRREGLGVIVLEARDRIGGRVLTLRDARVPVPIELGAEFVHGEAPETNRLLREAGEAVLDLAGEPWQRKGGRLQPAAEYWRQVDRVLAHAGEEGSDLSLDDWLAKKPAASCRVSTPPTPRG